MINWILGKYIVFETSTGKSFGRYRSLTKAQDRCQQLNTDAYFQKTGKRYDINETSYDKE